MKRNRTQLALGVLLILLGAWFIAQRSVPALGDWVDLYFEWPLNIVGIGAIIFLLGLILGAPGLSVPAAIVAGVGGILYYQNMTGMWESWSYMWTLIPGFVGVGTFVAGLLGDNTRSNIRGGLNLVVISTVLFLVFGAAFGGLDILGSYGPGVLIVLLGLYLIGRGLIRARKRGGSDA